VRARGSIGSISTTKKRRIGSIKTPGGPVRWTGRGKLHTRKKEKTRRKAERVGLLRSSDSKHVIKLERARREGFAQAQSRGSRTGLTRQKNAHNAVPDRRCHQGPRERIFLTDELLPTVPGRPPYLKT